MKKLIALTLVTLGIATSARAQWVVYDPAVHTQQILDEAQNIAKYIEMINNQVQQIQTLTDQLNEFKHYEDLFGDPKAVLLTTVQPLVNDLRKTGVGQALMVLDDTANALGYVFRLVTRSNRRLFSFLNNPGPENLLRCGPERDGNRTAPTTR